MTWSPAIEAQVARGQVPDPDAIAAVATHDEVRLGGTGVRRRGDELRSQLLGLGPLQVHVDDPAVTDVLVNGDGSVWVDRGEGLQRRPGIDGPDAVRRLAVRLAALAHRRLDDSQPWVDGLLPDGARLHAVLPPLAAGGAHISLRIPRRRAGGLDDLQRLGMITPSQLTQLRDIVTSRTAFVITGGTGSGKTTLLAAMLAEVPPDERLVLVEDVGELAVAHPHVVSLQSRAANTEGAGEVTMVHLVRQALRMRPDRLVVGEVRGAEVRDLLLALNTGHEGGCGTLHANAPEDVPARFEALGALAGMSREAVRTQLDSAVEVVVHLRREGRRRVVGSIAPMGRSASLVPGGRHARSGPA